MKSWFAAENGPRGWIIGPLICLWASAFDRQGPMLFGWISGDSFGTKLRGRAGSDLNGLAVFALLIPVLAFLLYQMISDGSATPKQILIIGGLILLSPLVFWWSHRDRRSADPLVYFIRRTIEARGAATINSATSNSMKLIISGQEVGTAPTSEAVRDALCGMAPGDFLVLEIASETYLQTALNDDGFVIEKREGDASRHFSGSKVGHALDSRLSTDEIADAFDAYLRQRPEPHWLQWQKMDLA